MNKKSNQRRYDLDWLRVFAILFVFIYHSSRFFNLEDWHVKNISTYFGVEVWNTFASSWLMPLIFVISGASLFYAMGKVSIGTIGKFIKDKVLRLFVPLMVGAFTHASLQVYLERLTHGQFTGSYFEFIPHYFEGIYGFGGNFNIVGMHLWYLGVLFVFSIVFLPLFLGLKSKIGARLLGRFTDFLAVPGLIYLFAMLILLSWKLIDPDSLLGFDKFGWNLGVYISFFLSGFVFFSSEKLQHSIQKLRWLSLVGLITFTVLLILGQSHRDLIAWFFILAFLGFGTKQLNISTPLLKYANEAVLPFYILHQTVLLCVGYYVVQWNIPDLLKWLLIVPIAFAIIMGLYEYLVRRNNVMRFLFGMKPLVKPLVSPAIEAQITRATRTT
ncbi:MAG TPA: acyltransferase family protein [Anaerolineales bacterium]